MPGERYKSSIYHYIVVLVIVHSLSHVQLFATPWIIKCQAPLSSIISWSVFKSLNRWYYLTTSSAAFFFACLQSFPVSESFSMSQLIATSGQSIGVSILATMLPMNIQGWFPLSSNGVVSLQSKKLSSTTVQKQQFFRAQPSLWSRSHIHTRLLEKNITLTRHIFVVKVMPLLFSFSL